MTSHSCYQLSNKFKLEMFARLGNPQIIVLDNGPNIPRLTLENSQPIIDLNALQVAQGIPNDMEGQRE